MPFTRSRPSLRQTRFMGNPFLLLLLSSESWFPCQAQQDLPRLLLLAHKVWKIYFCGRRGKLCLEPHEESFQDVGIHIAMICFFCFFRGSNISNLGLRENFSEVFARGRKKFSEVFARSFFSESTRQHHSERFLLEGANNSQKFLLGRTKNLRTFCSPLFF